MKIWGRRNSTNVKKVLWCAEELGIQYEQIDAGGAFGKVSEPEYRALNPNGLIPTVQEDDGFVLWESNAIIRYLAVEYGNSSLYPEKARQRACIDQWMDWGSSSIAPPYRDIFVNLIRTPADKRNLQAVESGMKRCEQLFEIADKALDKQAYFGSDTFSIADISIGPYIYAWLELPIQRPRYAHLLSWYERLKNRPAFAKTVMLPLS